MLNRGHNNKRRKIGLPVTRLKLDLDAFSSLFGLLEASLLVDVDLLAASSCWTADAVFFVDTDLLLEAGVAAVGWEDGG